MRRRMLVLFIVTSLLVPLLPAPSAHAAPVTDFDRAGAGLASFAQSALGRIGDNAILDSPLPVTARSIRELLALDTVFANTLGDAVDDLTNTSTAAGLKSAIEGASKTVNGVKATYDSVVVSDPAEDGSFTVDFGVALSTTQTLPLAYQKIRHVETGPDEEGEDDLILELVGDESNGGIPATVAMERQALTFKYDPAAHLDGLPGSGLALQTPGTPFVFTAAGERSPVSFDAVYGFADIAVAGKAGFDLRVESDITDADGLSGVTFDEWSSMLPADLFDVARVDVGDATDVDIALDFNSTLISGDVDGTLVWSLTNAADAPSDSEPTLTAGAHLENFARVSPDDVLAGLGQYATVLTGAEADSSHELPFLDAGLADVYSPAGRIVEFIKRQSDAAVICGKADTQPPSGLGLPGTAWYCQAYTPVEPVATSIKWEITNGAKVSTDATGTAGVAPSANFAFTVNDGELRPKVSVTFQDPPVPTADETTTTDGATHTVVPRFATVNDLVTQLDAYLDGTGATSTVTPAYAEEDDALTFALDLAIEPGTADANLNFGDALRNQTRLAGLKADTAGDGKVTLSASGFVLDSTFGVDLSSDLRSIKPDGADDEVLESQGDRFFTLDETGPEFEVGDMSVNTETDVFELNGAVGFVNVEATGVDTDDVDSFKLAKKSGSDRLLAVEVSTKEGTTNGTGVDSSVLLNQVLTDLAGHITSDMNLQASAHLDISPAGNLASIVPDGADTQIDISWTDVEAQPQPVVTMGDGYKEYLYPLDIVPQLSGISFVSSGTHPSTAVSDSNRDFTTELGMKLAAGDVVPTTLYNVTTGASCFGVEIVSATSVKCVDADTSVTPALSGLAGGVDYEGAEDADGQLPIDNKWHQGNGYVIEGDAGALGPLVLEGLFDVASRFENHTGDGYDSKIPLLGVTPKDLVPQFGDIGREVHQILERYQEAPEGVATGDDAGEINGGPPASMQALVADLRSGLEVADSKLTLSMPNLARAGLTGERRHLKVALGTLDESGSSLPAPTPSPSASTTAPPQIMVEPSPSTDTAFGNDADSDPDLTLSWSSKVRLDLGFPLDIDLTPDDLMVLSGSGVDDLDVTVDGTAMDFSGRFGSMPVKFGTTAKKTGTHKVFTGTQSADRVAAGTAAAFQFGGTHTATAASTTVLTNTGRVHDFLALGVQAGATLTNTSDGNATCSLSSFTATTLTCAAALTESKDWSTGNAFTYSGKSNKWLTRSGSGSFLTEGVAADMALVNTTTGATCRITEVTATQLRCSDGLSTGAWSAGDGYKVVSTKTMTTTSNLAGLSTGQIITNTTDNATCTISAIDTSAKTVTCSQPLAGAGLPRWDKDDAWSIGSSTTTLNDPGAKFDELGIKVGTDVVKNTTTGNVSQCVITSLTADQLICSAGLKKSGDVATSWNKGDTYEIGGLGKTAMDLSYVLTGAANMALDGATEADGYMASLTGAFTGTSNDCDSTATSAHLCVRLSTQTTGTSPTYLGTIEYTSNADGTGRTSVIPKALSDAATANGIAMDFDLLGEPLRYLPTMVRDGLDGNQSDEFSNVPFIGTDLSAGAEVVDTLEEIALPTGPSNVDWETIGNAARNAANAEAAESSVKTEVDKVLADAFGTGAPTSTVTATCGNIRCKATDTNLGRITDLNVKVTLKDNLASGESDPTKGCLTKCGTATTDIPFDLGLPGLNMKALNGAQAVSKVGWSLDLEFGLDKDEGPYLVTSQADELQIGAGVQFRDGDTSCATDRPKPGDDIFPTGTQTNMAEAARVKPSDFSTRCIDSNIGLFEGTLWDGATAESDESKWAAQYKDRSRLNLLTKYDFKANSGNKLNLVDLVTEDHASKVALNAAANIDALFRTKKGSEQSPDLPIMYGTLHVSYDTSRSGDPLNDVEYLNLMVDKFSFFEQFVGPWLGQFAKSMSPVLPFFTSITTPVPVISDVATATGNPPITIIDLLEAYAAHKTKPNKDAKETSWKYLIKVLKVVKIGAAIAGASQGWGAGTTGIGGMNGPIPSSGGFKADSEIAKGSTCGANGMPSTGTTCTRKHKTDSSILKKAGTVTERVKVLGTCPKDGCTGKELTRRISTAPTMGALQGAGVSFPWMNDAALLQGMLVGEDATLVRFDTGMFYAGVGISVNFGPFMAGPIPVEIYLGITITAGFRAAFGIDTSGLRAQREGDQSADMMDGFYFDDYDDTGKEVPEVQLIFTVTLGASVSVRVFKVGIEGEVTITFGLDLNDPNDDGKIFAAEFRSMGSDPICMWDATGYLDFVLRVFVEVNLVLWSKRWSYELFRLKPRLKMFEIGCQRPDPALAWINAAGNLELNIGDRATERDYEEEKTNERFVVTQLEPEVAGQATSVSVSAFGLVQTQARGVVFEVASGKKIVADGGSGNDAILFQAGNDKDGKAVPFTLTTSASGGAGNDILEGGVGPDTLTGGPDSVTAPATDTDTIKGSEGDDHLIGGADRDSIDGGIGADLIDGGEGTDSLSGGPAADLIQGGVGDDTISGGPGLPRSLAEKAIPVEDGVTAAARESAIGRIEDVADLLIGQGGNDSITGHFGNDYIFGDDFEGSSSSLDRAFMASSSFPGGTVTKSTACSGTSGTGHDTLDGEAGLDAIFGGDGNDAISGGKGGDELCGSAGHDLVEGDSSSATPYVCASGATGCVNDPMEDVLSGGRGNDRLLGRVGNDTITGDEGNDYVLGEDGNDKLRGGTGADIVLSGTGNDIVLGDEGSYGSTAISTSGNDVSTSASNSTSSESGLARCFDVINVVDGGFDVNGDGLANDSDDGMVVGVPIIDGRADMDFDGTIGTSETPDPDDSGVLGTILLVVGTKADTDGDGDVDGSDDGVYQLFSMMSSGDADCLRGGADPDALFGGGGGDDVSGDSGADFVAGNDGADVLRGAVDDDVIKGAAGVDTLYGDSGEDSLFGGLDNDSIWGGLDDDYLEGNEHDDTLSGDAGVDYLIGGSTTSEIDGKDTINGDEGEDIAIGDNGTISSTGTVDLLDVQVGNGSVDVTYSGDDTITGGPRADRLFGQGGDDTVVGDGSTVPSGTEGNDHLVGGSGSDTMSGGVGDDRLIGGSESAGANDTNTTKGGDDLNGGAGTDYILGDNGTIVATTSSTTMTRSQPDDARTSDGDDNHISGDDRIFGDGGTDHVQAGGGNDTVYGDARTADQETSGDVDRIQGNAGADLIYGHQGADEIMGGSNRAGNVDSDVGASGQEAGDVIYGHDGNDIVFGDNATITTGGSGRHDDFTTNDGDDNALSGNDTIFGDAGTDAIQGQGGNDSIFGDARTPDEQSSGALDRIQGNAGADLIYGHQGPDEIIGGTHTEDEDTTDNEIPTGPVDENVDGVGDTIYGNTGQDSILGDNGTVSGVTLIRARDATQSDSEDNAYSGDDSIFGDAAQDRIQGQGGNDLIYGDDRVGGLPINDSDRDLIQGNAGADEIHGGGGADHLTGGSHTAGVIDENVGDEGDDIYGDDGDDRVLGDNGTIRIADGLLARHDDNLASANNASDDMDNKTSGDDDIFGDGGIDHIQAQGGDDLVYGDVRTDGTAVGTAGADLIQGNSGSDVIHAGAGIDDVIGGSDLAGRIDETTSRRGGPDAGDEIHGDADNDRILGDNGTISSTGTMVRLDESLAANKALADGDTEPTAGDHTDDLTSGDDHIYGNGGTDDIQAQGGNDNLFGDVEIDHSDEGVLDRIQGNAGADHIYGHGGADDITGGTDTAAVVDTNVGGLGDRIYGHAGEDRVLGDNGTIGSTGIVRHDDATVADSDDNLVSNDDDIYGDGEVDRVQAGGGDDRIFGDERAAGTTVAGSADIIQANAGSDVVYGHGGDDDITGGSDAAGRVDANTTRRGTFAAGAETGDAIDGGPGLDYILGDNGTLTTVGGARNWQFFDLDEGAGGTVDAAFSGRDSIVGDEGEDRIFGQGDNDAIAGSAGDDRIQGNAGADGITGDAGADDIVGGSATHHASSLTNLKNIVDGNDTISGSSSGGVGTDAGDVILGDNGVVTRGGAPDPNTGDPLRTVALFDVENKARNGHVPASDVSGIDTIAGYGGRDYIYGQAKDDIVTGGDGDDSIEGNGAADTIDGEGGNDDVVGGSSVKPTSDGGPAAVGPAHFPGVTHAADGNDTITTDVGDDAILGDNGSIGRRVNAGTGVWATYSGRWSTLLQRDVLAANAAEEPGSFGNDRIDTGAGHDEVHGELGDDTIQAKAGDDSVIGDLGKIDMQVVAGPASTIKSAAPFIVTDVNVPGMLRRNTQLWVQTDHGGNDTITGGHGNDVVHAGQGADVVDGNGTIKEDSDGSQLLALTERCKGSIDGSGTVQPDPLECDRDILFGDDGADTIWGGPDHDHIYGGWGTDRLDVVTPDFGDRTVDFKDADFIYGGWDSDILQADQSQPNPNGMDKLIDAQGAFNDYQVCENAYGGNSVIRAVDPGMITFLQAMATDDGAMSAGTKGSSGYRELSIVFSNEVKFNSSPAIQPTNATCSDAAYLFGLTVVEEEVVVEPSPTPTESPTAFPSPTATVDVGASPSPTPTAEVTASPSPTTSTSPTPAPTKTKKN